MQKRMYTVQQMADAPCISLRGNWLRDYGLDYGSKLNLIEGKNMIILIKIPDEVAKQQQRTQEIKRLEKQIKDLKISGKGVDFL